MSADAETARGIEHNLPASGGAEAQAGEAALATEADWGQGPVVTSHQFAGLVLTQDDGPETRVEEDDLSIQLVMFVHMTEEVRVAPRAYH